MKMNSDKWIAIVNNSKTKNVEFYAIDHCVTILRENGDDEKRCDGLLLYSNNLIFVELKSRKKKWFKEGQEQLKSTIDRFKENHKINDYNKVCAYVCNNLRPKSNTAKTVRIQKFKDNTEVIFRDKNEINLT